jgi:hypothetical protein
MPAQSSFDWLFTGQFKYLPIEMLTQKETGPVAELVEKGADLLDLAKPLGFEENAQNSQRAKAEAGCCMAALLLIKQDELRSELDRQRQSLSFAAVEITSKDHHQISIANVVVLDP